MSDIVGRVPPHNLDAEAAVLSAALLDPEARDIALEALEPQHFYSDANRLIFEAARELALAATRDATIAVDVVTVVARLRDQQKFNQAGGHRYLAQIVDATPAVSNVEAHCRVVREKWRLRQLIRTCQKYAAEGYGDVGEPQGFFDAAEQAIFKITHMPTRSETEHVSVALTTAFQRISDAAARGDDISGTPTGFPDLDKLLSGLHDGDLAIVAARPGMGKSALALNMAVNIASPVSDGQGGIAAPGKGVVFFSLEMPKEQLAIRMACSEARVDLHKARTPSHLDIEDWQRLTEASAYIAKLPLWIDDQPAIGLFDLRAKVRRKQAEAARRDCWACGGSGETEHGDCEACGGTGVFPIKLGAVIVDYLQLMGGHKRQKGESREQEVSAYSRGLKALAKELGVPVIAVAQLNRQVEQRAAKDKRPVLADLRESGAIEQDADTIVFIYRDDYYNRESDERGIAELIIGKQRNGPTGIVRVRWTAACTRFDSLAPDRYCWSDYVEKE